jgi:hypothetical protein
VADQLANHLTVGDVAKLYGVAAWQVRRCVDRLDVEVPRAGGWRLIPRELLGDVAAALRDCGWLPSAKTSA